MKSASIPAVWLQWARRWDAAYLIAVREEVQRRGIADDDHDRVREVMEFVASRHSPNI